MKYFEIRDAATFIPAIAFRFEAKTETERYLLARSGYGLSTEEQKQYLVLIKLDGIQAEYDPFRWPYSRTMNLAHCYIDNNWDTLSSGDVVDVQFILGETDEPKKTQQKSML